MASHSTYWRKTPPSWSAKWFRGHVVLEMENLTTSHVIIRLMPKSRNITALLSQDQFIFVSKPRKKWSSYVAPRILPYYTPTQWSIGTSSFNLILTRELPLAAIFWKFSQPWKWRTASPATTMYEALGQEQNEVMQTRASRWFFVAQRCYKSGFGKNVRMEPTLEAKDYDFPDYLAQAKITSDADDEMENHRYKTLLCPAPGWYKVIKVELPTKVAEKEGISSTFFMIPHSKFCKQYDYYTYSTGARGQSGCGEIDKRLHHLTKKVRGSLHRASCWYTTGEKLYGNLIWDMTKGWYFWTIITYLRVVYQTISESTNK